MHISISIVERPLPDVGLNTRTTRHIKAAVRTLVLIVGIVVSLLTEGLLVASLAASGEHLILSAADSNQIAIPGNPPLTVGLMHNISGFTQWALDIRFSDAQEQQFNQILQLYWAMNDRDEIAGGILAGVVYQRLPALDGSQRVQLQQQFKSKLLSNLYSDSDRPDHQWLLLIYRAHHPEEGPPAENNNDGINAFKNWADSNRQFNGIMNDRMIFPSLR